MESSNLQPNHEHATRVLKAIDLLSLTYSIKKASARYSRVSQRDGLLGEIHRLLLLVFLLLSWQYLL